MLTFEKLREINSRRNLTLHELYKCRNWDEVDWSNAIAGEAGEICNATKKRSRGAKPEDQIPLLELGKEIADTVLYCDLLASHLGLKLEDLVELKFNEVSDRYNCDIKL